MKSCILILVVATLFVNTLNAETLYFNDFESLVGSEWSNNKTEITPIGNRSFLGQFSSEKVSLEIDNIPIESSLKLSFDAFILGSWDGSNEIVGPDFLILSIDGNVLLNTTFSNHQIPNYSETFLQSYPNSYSSGISNEPFTGASETYTLGYTHPHGIPMDSVYFLEFYFTNLTSKLTIDFSAIMTAGITDESWGLDNVKVEIIPEPTTIALLTLGGLILRRIK